MNASTQPARLRPFRPQPFGRYTLLSHLATGGMGDIYLARLEGAQGFEKLCVIKKILPQLAADPDFVERFVGEARTLVRLSHGSIAQVLDMGLHEGEAYMALEYVDGKDLRKVAARVRDRQLPLPLTYILHTMGRVLDALAYAHRKKDDDGEELKLVHRDISPQNILISYEGEVKVIDFGLAKSRLSAAKTNPSIILGKFLYMSPEQARHQPVDRRSDLYAVGLCLYELISGKNPFDSVHPGELMTVVAQPKIAPLDEVEPLTPRGVTALVTKALAVEPSQRFQTAEEFRGRLHGCLMEIDASAGPESVSRFMRELFAADFQAERRLLATLKEVARVPAGESWPEEGGPAPRPMAPAVMPPKTVRLDGPVQPLSFQPTPRSREGGGPVTDGETRPGVMVDASTRPAFAREALAEEARVRASRQHPAVVESASSVEVRPEAFDRPVPPPALTREVPMVVLPPEALPPAPEPRPTLAQPDVQPRTSPEMPWHDVAEPPAASTAESNDPGAEALASSSSEPQPARAAGMPPPPPPPLPPPPAMAAAVPPRTGGGMMPAIAMAAPVPPPPRTASLTAMPMVVAPPPPGSTPSRGTPSVEPSGELDVVAGVAGSEEDVSWGEDAAASDAEGGEEWELPILTPEEMDHAEDVPRPGEVDTNPRFARPSRTERTEDTQPRVAARDGGTDPRVQQRNDDTRPRAVLDDALQHVVEGNTGEPEEKSGPNRPRAVPRRPRTISSVGVPAQGAPRRTGSIPAVRSAPAPAQVEDDEDQDVHDVPLPSHEQTRRTPMPVRPGSEPVAWRPGEDTRRTALPSAGSNRKGSGLMAVGLVVALMAGAILTLALSPALRASMGLDASLLEGPPPPKPLGPTRRSPSGTTGSPHKPTTSTGTGAEPVKAGAANAPQTGEGAQAARAAAPTEAAATEAAPSEAAAAGAAAAGAAAVGAAPTGAADAKAGSGALAGEALAASPAEAALQGAVALKAVPEAALAAREAVAIDDADVLAPLPTRAAASPAALAPKQAPVKRPQAPARKVRGTPRGKDSTPLQAEWRETNALYKKLESQFSCLQLGLWCNRYDDIRNEVEAAGSSNDTETLRKVRDMKRDLLAKKRDLE